MKSVTIRELVQRGRSKMDVTVTYIHDPVAEKEISDMLARMLLPHYIKGHVRPRNADGSKTTTQGERRVTR